MGLIKASLKNPFMVASIVLLILVLGIVALRSIPIDILPVFKAPAVQVLTYYPGMPPTSIEKTITSRMERWAGQANGCMRVESKSVLGVSTVKCYFREDIDPNGALTQVNSLALGTLAFLPPNIQPPVVLPFDPTGTMPLGILTVSNPNMNEAQVKDLARIQTRNMLNGIRGCVAPVVVGGKDRTVLVYIDRDKLEARKLSLLDVVDALKQSNLMATPGVAYIGQSQFLLDSNAMVNRVQEINDFPILTSGGQQIFISDIGHAEDAYAIQTSRVRIDGKQQVYVPIYRQGGASSLAVAEAVQNKKDEMQSRLPEGTTLKFIMDQSVYVRQAIEALLHEGIIGAALVSVMILVFLGSWRMTLIASLSIPLSILGAVIGLQVTGNTINVMTLGGLALAIGPLVDDAIVGLENHHRHYHMGKTRARASLDGTVEVMIPVLVATFTTTVVLAPVALMPGMGGFLFRPLALAVAFAMATSFLLSRTFVPMLCSRILPEEHGPAAGQPGTPLRAEHHTEISRGFFSRLHERFDRGMHAVTYGYGNLLHWALRHRALILGGVLILFVASLFLLRRIGQEFFPQVDAGQITVYVRAPSQSRLDATEKRVIEMEAFIKGVVPKADRETIVSEIGLDPDWSAAYSANSGQQDSVIRIQLKEHRQLSAQEYATLMRMLLDADFLSNLRHGDAAAVRRLEAAGAEVARRVRERLERDAASVLQTARQLADLRVSFDTGGLVSTALNYGVSSPIDIQIDVENSTAEQAQKLAHQITERISGVRGAVDIRQLQRLDAPYRIIEIDRQKANEVGLTARNVILQVAAALNSSVTIDRNFWIDTQTGNQYFVAVQYPEDTEKDLNEILDTWATGTRTDRTVKLSSLVSIHPSTAPVEVNHVDLTRTLNLLVNTEGRDLGSVAKDIQKRLADLPVPRGLKWSLRGEYSRMKESFGDLAWGLILATAVVYLLLMALFRSVVGPFIILFTVPLGLIGVLTMLWLTGTTLNVQSAMGVIFLVGIAVNNGVLLIDFANAQRKMGKSPYDAIHVAAMIRLRPILMTFLATFLDLIPMAIGMGRGSEATIPLARAVVGGLLTSTVLTLFVIPILFTLFIKDKRVGDVDAELEYELTRPLDLPGLDGHGHTDPHAGSHDITTALPLAGTGVSEHGPTAREKGPDLSAGP
jgi:multidrug efflux pump subunit AcrB